MTKKTFYQKFCLHIAYSKPIRRQKCQKPSQFKKTHLSPQVSSLSYLRPSDRSFNLPAARCMRCIALEHTAFRNVKVRFVNFGLPIFLPLLRGSKTLRSTHAFLLSNFKPIYETHRFRYRTSCEQISVKVASNATRQQCDVSHLFGFKFNAQHF